MTTIRKFEEKCAVCGKTSEQDIIMSTSTWGYPDLDLRPAEMQRSSMFAWLKECPHCGYVAGTLENKLEASPDILKSDAYLTCEGKSFKYDLSKKFYKRYLILKEENNHKGEFFSLLHCAWACDDNDDELAVEIRKLALNSIDKIVAEDDNEKNNLKLIKADLLRRSLQFDKLINEFKDLNLTDKNQNDVIKFQIELAMKKDSDCYTVEDALKKQIIY